MGLQRSPHDPTVHNLQRYTIHAAPVVTAQSVKSALHSCEITMLRWPVDVE